jgi:hypothetical protein
MEEINLEYKQEVLIYVITDMIRQENGVMSFEHFKTKNGYCSHLEFNKCMAYSIEWVMNNIDLWDYEELPYNKLSHRRSIKYSLKEGKTK